MNYLLTNAASNASLPWFQQWFFWTGIIAAICITIFCIPQLVKIVKTKDTSAISITMYVIYVIGCLCFLLSGIGMAIGLPKQEVQGSLSGGLPMGISNGIAGIFGIIILSIKCRNMRWAKKYGVTEKEIATNYYKYLKLAREAKAKKKQAKATSVVKKEQEAKDTKVKVDQSKDDKTIG